jgi:hypothetical protein
MLCAALALNHLTELSTEHFTAFQDEAKGRPIERAGTGFLSMATAACSGIGQPDCMKAGGHSESIPNLSAHRYAP